jgi:hypothetical protein
VRPPDDEAELGRAQLLGHGRRVRGTHRLDHAGGKRPAQDIGPHVLAHHTESKVRIAAVEGGPDLGEQGQVLPRRSTADVGQRARAGRTRPEGRPVDHGRRDEGWEIADALLNEVGHGLGHGDRRVRGAPNPSGPPQRLDGHPLSGVVAVQQPLLGDAVDAPDEAPRPHSPSVRQRREPDRQRERSTRPALVCQHTKGGGQALGTAVEDRGLDPTANLQVVGEERGRFAPILVGVQPDEPLGATELGQCV